MRHFALCVFFITGCVPSASEKPDSLDPVSPTQEAADPQDPAVPSAPSGPAEPEGYVWEETFEDPSLIIPASEQSGSDVATTASDSPAGGRALWISLDDIFTNFGESSAAYVTLATARDLPDEADYVFSFYTRGNADCDIFLSDYNRTLRFAVPAAADWTLMELDYTADLGIASMWASIECTNEQLSTTERLFDGMMLEAL